MGWWVIFKDEKINFKYFNNSVRSRACAVKFIGNGGLLFDNNNYSSSIFVENDRLMKEMCRLEHCDMRGLEKLILCVNWLNSNLLSINSLVINSSHIDNYLKVNKDSFKTISKLMFNNTSRDDVDRLVI
jgi:hypothetical protein